MLSQKVQELEIENKRLEMIIEAITKSDVPKPKDCRHCKNYIQYYCRDKYGCFHIVYAGHCICGVPVKKRKGKKNPAPEDTCLCFDARDIRRI